MGDKFSGKSSTMLYFINNYNAKFVTNDISLYDSEYFEGVGKSISIRRVSLEKFNLNNIKSNYPLNTKFYINNQWDDKYKISPKEFSQLFRVKITPKIKVNVIFYLKYSKDSGGIVRKYDCKQINQLLRRQIIDLKYRCPFLNCKFYEVTINENNQEDLFNEMYNLVQKNKEE
ncbi:hypothetical protein [Granulicatella sp. 19428wC4_WM01]|nr:hypothetical protein [Granulicatella sp. 19428wC4_WM01]MBF0780789.1 hypothetical protein [Granulicatella sp. 19428wC4_WM01]TFU93834.1 hypothetical protein E4T68_06725 [Granulicatella sp. WM01]